MIDTERFLTDWGQFDKEALNMPRRPTALTLKNSSREFNDRCIEMAEKLGITTNELRARLSFLRRQGEARDDALRIVITENSDGTEGSVAGARGDTTPGVPESQEDGV